MSAPVSRKGPDPEPRPRELTTVLFDVFGTLLDFHDDETPTEPWAELAAVLADQGAAVDGEELRRRRLDLVVAEFDRIDHVHADIDMTRVYRRLIADVLPGERSADDPDISALADTAAWTFRTAATTRRRAYPGAAATLTELRHRYRVAIASNTQRIYTERELASEGLLGLVDAVLFSSDVQRGKPDPLLLTEALRRLGVRPENAVYVGDNPYDDYVAATAAGIDLILIRHAPPYTHADLGLPRAIPIVSSYEELITEISRRPRGGR